MLFKLITYMNMIIEELNRRGTGYEDDQINVKSLFFDEIVAVKFYR